MGDGMRLLLHPGIMLVAALLVPACRPSEGGTDTGSGDPTDDQELKTEEQEQESGMHDPLGANAACYVCHMTFIREELSTTHLEAEIGCIECHGISAGHANDEDIGATPPDRRFERDDVNAFCRTCHETHDAAPEKVIARWMERHRQAADSQPATETASSQPAVQGATCTDCHGDHAI